MVQERARRIREIRRELEMAKNATGGRPFGGDKMKQAQYSLEILEPSNCDNVWITFSSSTPFVAIHEGDLINPELWPNSRAPMKILRVVKVEHMIWCSDRDVFQKVLVYTREANRASEIPFKKKTLQKPQPKVPSR